MKITIYELLGLIKDGKAPKKIKYQNYIYEYQHRRDTESSFNYMCNENGVYLSRRYFIDNILNEPVEIIEEEPRDIEVCGSLFTKSEYDKLAHCEEKKKIPEKLELIENGDFVEIPDNRDLMNKINEIIDYLESKGDK